VDLHKHDKYSTLLDGLKREQERLDKGLAESQGWPSTIQEPDEPQELPSVESDIEEEEKSTEEEEVDRNIQLTPIITTLPTAQMSTTMMQTATQ